MSAIKTDLYLGDCLEVLANFPADSFDLIVTSPPYADRRSKTYGGISPNEYVNWFMPRAEEFLRGPQTIWYIYSEHQRASY